MRDLPGELKRYDVEETTRSGGGVTTTYKLTEADARARGLIPAEKPAAEASSKKREAPTGRARKEAGSKSSSSDDS